MRSFRPLQIVIAALALSLLAHPPALVQTNPSLEPGIRVYDQTGASLSADQIADLERRLDSLATTGPDAIVVVRNLMATPDETLDQVETIQQEWASVTGIDDDLAVAILINRNPDNPNDARAGIYVGSALDDGNVPEGEQRAIVDDALIPTLRSGDVYTSLVNGIARLESSYVNGPPQSSFERWADTASRTWLAPLGTVLAIILGGITFWFLSKREVHTGIPLPPSTVRPDSLHPAIGGALATGGPQSSAIPATLLGLAEQGFITFEQESEGSFFAQPTLSVRLSEGEAPSNDVDSTLWQALNKQAKAGIVTSKQLQKVSADAKPVVRTVEQFLEEQGWTSRRLTSARIWPIWIALVGFILALVSLFVTGVGGNWIGVVATLALGISTAFAIWGYLVFSPFTRAGQSVAAPWKAYRSGLNAALGQTSVPLDLNAVLVDAVAMNLGSKAGKRVEAERDAGVVLNAFSGANLPVAFPVWVAFNSTVASASGSSGSTVSSGGAGGGGGAAGST